MAQQIHPENVCSASLNVRPVITVLIRAPQQHGRVALLRPGGLDRPDSVAAFAGAAAVGRRRPAVLLYSSQVIGLPQFESDRLIPI